MANRIDSLDVSVFTIDAGNLLARLKRAEPAAAATIVETQGLAQRHKRRQETAKETTIKCSLNVEDSSNVIVTNLEVTAITIGGTAYVAQSRNCKLAVRTITDEGKSGFVRDKWPNAMRSDYNLETTLMVTSAGLHALEAIHHTGTVADRAVTVTFAFGGITFTAPMVLEEANRVVEEEKIQTISVKLSSNGDPTSPAVAGSGFQAILYKMLLGTALFDVALTADGTASFASHATRKALLTELDIDAPEDEKVTCDCTFVLLGGGTIA